MKYKFKKNRSKQFYTTIVLLLITAIASCYYLFLFHINGNLREVVKNKVYRSAQPNESQLKTWIDRHAIKPGFPK